MSLSERLALTEQRLRALEKENKRLRDQPSPADRGQNPYHGPWQAWFFVNLCVAAIIIYCNWK